MRVVLIIGEDPTEAVIDAMAEAINMADIYDDERSTETKRDAARSAYQAMITTAFNPDSDIYRAEIPREGDYPNEDIHGAVPDIKDGKYPLSVFGECVGIGTLGEWDGVPFIHKTYTFSPLSEKDENTVREILNENIKLELENNRLTQELMTLRATIQAP